MQSSPPVPLQEKPHGHSMEFILDRPFYLPGQKVQGKVQVNLNHDTSVRSLNLLFQGVEAVRIVVGSGKSRRTYTSSRDMVNTGLQLLPKGTMQEGSTGLPFVFEIPPDALPSYAGKFAHVTWKLSAKADIPWGKDLSKELFVQVMNMMPSQPSPVAVENPEPHPKIRLALSSNFYQPGETLIGKLALPEPGNLRSLRAQLCIDERSTGKGTLMGLTSDTVTQTLPIGNEMRYSRDDLLRTSEIPFQIPLSTDAPCSYNGTCSSIQWGIIATLDIPHREDLHLSLPFTVALRPETPKVIPASPQSPGVEAQGAESMITDILSDGSPEDLVTISNRLQEKTGTFMQLNQVRDLCEKLVTEGKLERTSEGEFLAQYSLKW